MSVSSRPVLADLSVVIPSLGRPILRECLQSILNGSAWPSTLVVVDQGSEGDVFEWLHDMERIGIVVEHIRSTQTGTAAAMNRGLERVRTRFVAVTHDDCCVSDDWLERMLARLTSSPDAIITGRVDPEPGGEGFTPSVITSPCEAVYTQPLLDRDPLFPANMGFSKSTATSVGQFNEGDHVRYAEDAEWSYRALRSGVPIVYAPEVVVEHRDWRNAQEVAITYRRYARSQGGFYGSYLREGDRYILRRVAFDLLRGPWIWLRGVVTGHRELVIIGRAYVTQLLPGIMEGLRNERHR